MRRVARGVAAAEPDVVATHRTNSRGGRPAPAPDGVETALRGSVQAVAGLWFRRQGAGAGLLDLRPRVDARTVML